MNALVLHAAHDLRLEACSCDTVGPGQVRVRMATGGICGSDLHYFNHGGFGSIRVREPIVLGHEVSGVIDEVGDGVKGLREGQLVAVSPSQPCGTCQWCRAGMLNHCTNMRFLGSAMRFPHVQGAFRGQMVVPAGQCVPSDGLAPGAAATAEPLSVCLHASNVAGNLAGKAVLVTGCGPIGILMIMVALHRGAERVTATDVASFPLEIAQCAGAERTVDVSASSSSVTDSIGENQIDVLFECSGAPGVLASVVPVLKPQGRVVQVGFGGSAEVPMSAFTAKELRLKGSFRFTTEFPEAVELLRTGAIDPSVMITHTLPVRDALAAFELAGDRYRAIKVQLDLRAL